MIKTVDYVLLSATQKKAMTEKVQKWIAKGWEPQGGVAIDNTGDHTTFYQVVIERKEV